MEFEEKPYSQWSYESIDNSKRKFDSAKEDLKALFTESQELCKKLLLLLKESCSNYELSASSQKTLAHYEAQIETINDSFKKLYTNDLCNDYTAMRTLYSALRIENRLNKRLSGVCYAVQEEAEELHEQACSDAQEIHKLKDTINEYERNKK